MRLTATETRRAAHEPPRGTLRAWALSAALIMSIGLGAEADDCATRFRQPQAVAWRYEVVDAPPQPPGNEASPNVPACACGSLWVINTRCLPDLPCCAVAPLTPVVQVCRDGRWQNSTLDEFHASGKPTQPTIVYLHGNLTDSCEAIEIGHRVFAHVDACGCVDARRVIWSWPSDRACHRLWSDTRYKADRADDEGYYFGQFLRRIPASQRVSMIAFSFGARTTMAALHLLDGGSIDGRALSDETAPRGATPPPRRAILLAGALDYDALVPGDRYGQSLNQVERCFFTVNPLDPALRYYYRLDPSEGAHSIGYVGAPDPQSIGYNPFRLEGINVSRQIGRRHGSFHYFNSSTVMAYMRREALFLSQPQER